MVELNEQQKAGLELAIDRFQKGEPYTVIAGLPGTGKTFLAVQIVKELGLTEREYGVATFTGKAASVLQSRGLPAQTLHKLLYKTVPLPRATPTEEQRFAFIPKGVKEGDLSQMKILLIDEISMVPNNLLATAAKHGIHVLALGDKNQLPPIGEDNGLLNKPHINLTQIMRQEEGNSIIKFCRELLTIQKYSDIIEWSNDDMVKVIDREDVVDGMFGWADQILCSTNRARASLNAMIRQFKGFSHALPEVGEKVIFTRNDWETFNSAGFPIVNGMTGEIISTEHGRARGQLETQRISVQSDFTAPLFNNLEYDKNFFLTGQRTDFRYVPKKLRLQELDFGYAITIHKSQGSEYDHVLLFEESLRSDIDLAALYTGASRAKMKLVVVRNPRKSFIKVI